jgi:hypothetical protein
MPFAELLRYIGPLFLACGNREIVRRERAAEKFRLPTTKDKYFWQPAMPNKLMDAVRKTRSRTGSHRGDGLHRCARLAGISAQKVNALWMRRS